ncbi:MAG TPA: dTDP-4-dehydrorhamnose reductase [Terriglobales bacterium]|nr:dTDP-4-dehydrorhamnose reductase [Terriglobales bacterium]
MRVTLFGASGLLGKELVRSLGGVQLSAHSSRDADLRDAARVSEVVRESRPDWIVLAAAYADVDGCEANRELAFAVNHQGAVHVAQAARETSARLLFLSTDYVFDGTKGSPYETGDSRNPINVYGETKRRAEEALLELIPDVCIVRTSWLFGHGGKCFPGTILKVATPTPASPTPRLRVVNDQRGSPTFAPDLADAIAKLCERNAQGLIHATNAGDCTWYDVAKESVAIKGLPAIVDPVSTAEFPRPARRPVYSVLSPASLHAYNIRMPAWQDALRRYLDTSSAR